MFNMLNRVGARSRAASLATPILPAHHVHHHSNPKVAEAAAPHSPPGSPLRISSTSSSSSGTSPPLGSSPSQSPPRSASDAQSRGHHQHHQHQNSQSQRARVVVIPSLSEIFEQLRGASEKEIEVAGKSLLNITTASHSSKRAQIATHAGFPRVVQLLTEGSPRTKILATAIVSNLASTSDDIRARLVELGVVDPLLANAASPHHCVQQVSMQAICNLSAGAGHAALYDAGAISRVIEVMRAGNDECKPHAVGVLNNLSSLCEAAKSDIFEAGAIPLLLEVLEQCTHAETKERAAYTLWNLSSEAHIRSHLFKIGAAKHIVRQLTCPEMLRSMTPPKSHFERLASTGSTGSAGERESSGGEAGGAVESASGSASSATDNKHLTTPGTEYSPTPSLIRSNSDKTRGRRRSASVVV